MDTIPQNTPLKQCKVCKEWLSATKAYFHADNTKRHKDHFKPECKKCRGGGRTFGYTPKECQEEEKECLGCHEIWPATEEYFNKSPRNKGGLWPRCKKCRGKGTTFGEMPQLKEYRENEKWCPSCKKWLPKNTDVFVTDNRRKDGYYPYCKVCGVKDRKKRHATIDRQQKAYYHNNKEKRYALTRSHKARKQSIAGTHTSEQVQEQLRRQKHRCYYAACGFSKFKKRNGKYLYHVEHTFPLSRVVGTDIPANDMSYLVLACPSCNLSKNDKFPWEWPEGGRLF